MPDGAALIAALRAMLPAVAGVGVARTSGSHPLWPGEDVPGAVPHRLREFAAGRAAARAALAAMGVAPGPIPMRADRAPQWPAGLAGSITHAGDWAMAAVVRLPSSIGIDMEPDEDLPADVVDTILTPVERRDVRGLRAARVVFSAKESFFKAQYPRTGAVIGFDAVTVSLYESGFVLTVVQPLPGFPAAARIAGHWTRAEGHILTAVTLA